MPEYYTYLLSSLPVLSFGSKPPFSFDEFIQRCNSLVPEEEIEIIKAFQFQGGFSVDDKGTEVLKRWREFDITLRNELIKVRAARKRIDPERYLRHDGHYDAQIIHIASLALRNPSIFEAEKSLDWERWRLLDELSCGHYFDFESLVIYALKLLILERWTKIDAAKKERIMQETIGH